MSKDRREVAEDKAERLVEKELSTCLPHLIRLNREDEDFQINLQIFRLLYKQKNPDYIMALWNKLALWGHNLDSPLITEEERKFIATLETA